MKKLTKELIEAMSYTDFISLIKETNRCPGGKDSIRKILLNTFTNKDSYVLEVGSNTGFTSLEIAHTLKCKIEGIDISESCVAESREKLLSDNQQIQQLVNFRVGSAYDIPFEDNTFDLVVTGGATSFMDDKQRAVNEYKRVVKPWGFISATQLFYVTKPPQHVLNNVSKAIGVEIKPWGIKDWLSVFYNHQSGLEVYWLEENELQSRNESVIEEYIQYFMDKPHLSTLAEELRNAIYKKWKAYVDIFNENHRYLGYFIALFRKQEYLEEPELFIRKGTWQR